MISNQSRQTKGFLIPNKCNKPAISARTCKEPSLETSIKQRMWQWCI